MTGRDGIWGSLERWKTTAFLVGGLLMAVDAVVVAAMIVTGVERLLLVGQTFVGVAWTAALLGLLGLYPALADRSRWLSRVGALFAAIGVVVFAVMAVTVAAYLAGIPAGEYGDVGMYFIPGVLVGSVLGFVTFSVASLRTGVHSRTLGLLLLVPAILVLANILRFVAGFESTTITLAIVVGDSLTMLAIGQVLRTGIADPDRTEQSIDSPA